MARDVIPAVAQTTSSAPSCSTPRSVAACTSSVTDVDDLADDPSTRFGDQPDRLVEVGQRGGRNDDGVDRTADIERDDVGTLLRETHRLRTPDPPCSACDQGDFSFQPVAHHALPSRPASTTSWVPVM